MEYSHACFHGAQHNFNNKGKESAWHLGTSLGATYIVEGSVRMEQDLIRTNVQLIATEHGRQVWAKRYDRVLIDQLTTQDELADTITTAIHRQFGLEESDFKPSPAQRYLKDILSSQN
ncbi:MAG: hypothetical protein AAF525_15610 [Pseudomonadota bacterium]